VSRDAGSRREIQGSSRPPAGGRAGAPEGGPATVVATKLGSLRELWKTSLSVAKAQGGQALALRGVRPVRLDGRTLVLEVPPGLRADLEAFLSDGARSGWLREALAERLGSNPDEFSICLEESGKSERLTARTSRKQRVEEMVALDPALREAVEKLDLTLKERPEGWWRCTRMVAATFAASGSIRPSWIPPISRCWKTSSWRPCRRCSGGRGRSWKKR